MDDYNFYLVFPHILNFNAKFDYFCLSSELKPSFLSSSNFYYKANDVIPWITAIFFLVDSLELKLFAVQDNDWNGS